MRALTEKLHRKLAGQYDLPAVIALWVWVTFAYPADSRMICSPRNILKLCDPGDIISSTNLKLTEDTGLKYYYHGSNIPGISQLEARSKLHNTEEKVVYLTDCIPYALFYIWDSDHNKYSGKHVTGWVKNGVAYYEEQFSEQLKTFYQGVAGSLYCIADDPDIKPVAGRDNLYYYPADVTVSKVEQILDVYEELLKYEAEGLFAVLRYNEQSTERQEELTNLIASAIAQARFFEDNQEQREFMKKHFSKAWEIAERNQ